MKHRSLIALMALASCGRDQPPPPAPPIEEMVRTPGDWSSLAPAVGQTPGQSLMLLKGPIVTDFDAMLGEHAVTVRDRLNGRGGVLGREGGLLVSITPPGPEAAYLIVDEGQHALEVGWNGPTGWTVKRTAAAEISPPPSVLNLVGARP